MIWHRHLWREVGRMFTGRLSKTTEMKCSERMAERLVFGVTVLDMRCTSCGERKSVEMLGQHIQTPNEVSHDL